MIPAAVSFPMTPLNRVFRLLVSEGSLKNKMKGFIKRTRAKAQSRLIIGDTITVILISELAKYNDVNPKITMKMHASVADITAKKRPTGKKNVPTPQL
jgi:hypothetical protein